MSKAIGFAWKSPRSKGFLLHCHFGWMIVSWWDMAMWLSNMLRESSPCAPVIHRVRLHGARRFREVRVDAACVVDI
jgi:hypothetical protein